MKKIEVRPEKVRGMGNLIPPLSVSDFELSDCMIHEEDPFKINGHLFNHFSIDVPVVPVNLVLSTNVATIYPDATTPNTAVITATLTDSSGAPVPNVDVYFQEEGVRIGTASTNAQGACTFEYSNSSGGTHTIRAYTAKQGKYNKSSAEIKVNVYMPTSLSLSPVSTSANTVDIVTLSSKIIDQNDLPLAGKLIDLYRGDVKIKSAYSNSKGIVDFPIRVTDLGKTNTVLTCTTDKSSVTVGENVLCILYLKDNQNNPLANKTVYCEDWSKTTNDEGRVIFNYANPSTGAVTKVFKFDGDNLYNGASVTVNWTVVPAENPPVLVLESVGDLVGETGDLITFNLDSSEHLNLGETVQLINTTDNSVLDSCTIKSNDNTLNYTCIGKGDVSVKAKVVRGTEVTYSNIQNLEDCFIYGFKGDETFSLRSGYTGTLNISYTANNELKFTASSRVLALMDKSFTTPKNWVVEFDMKATGYDGGRIGIQRKDGSSAEKSCVALKPQNSITYANLSKSETTTSTDTNIGSYSSYNHYKIIAKDGKTSLYRDNISKVSVENNDWLDKEICLYLHGWTNSSVIYIKNFKAKVYLE
nr:MAG TPA: Ig-like domain protein [Caudoviricetes sp.]